MRARGESNKSHQGGKTRGIGNRRSKCVVGGFGAKRLDAQLDIYTMLICAVQIALLLEHDLTD